MGLLRTYQTHKRSIKLKLMNTFQIRLLLIISFFCSILFNKQTSAQTGLTYFSVTGKLTDSISKKEAGWATVNLVNSAKKPLKQELATALVFLP